MTEQKDLEKIKEILVGKDFQRFEGDFAALQAAIDALEAKLNETKEALLSRIESLEEEQSAHAAELENHEAQLKVLDEKLDAQNDTLTEKIEALKEETEASLSRLKTDLTMRIDTKSGALEREKVSRKSFAKLLKEMAAAIEDAEETHVAQHRSE